MQLIRRYHVRCLASLRGLPADSISDQGQGGAQAIEDAAALGALFLSDTKPEQITERLQMYNDIRYERTVTILFTSRVGVEDRAEVMGDLKRYVPDAKLPENSVLYAWDSYPVKAAEQALASAARPR
jgi:salicylate hydroxylase